VMHTVSGEGMCGWKMMKTRSIEKIFLQTPKRDQIPYLLNFYWYH